ncbi:MAG: hypothetical protein U0350_45625 [Caldilineaceae bacterium]
MKHHQSYRPISINLFDLLMVLWGCGMLPLSGLDLYSSVKEAPILVQSLVLSLAALGAALCFVIAPLLRYRKGIASVGLIFAAGFTVAHLIYNGSTFTLLLSGLTFALIFFWLPGVLLFLSSLPHYQARFFGRMSIPVNAKFWLILMILVGLLFLVLGGLYGIGFSISLG